MKAAGTKKENGQDRRKGRVARARDIMYFYIAFSLPRGTFKAGGTLTLFLIYSV